LAREILTMKVIAEVAGKGLEDRSAAGAALAADEVI
jgi:hypothetical protein